MITINKTLNNTCNMKWINNIKVIKNWIIIIMCKINNKVNEKINISIVINVDVWN